jgi:hypothetical protein
MIDYILGRRKKKQVMCKDKLLEYEGLTTLSR